MTGAKTLLACSMLVLALSGVAQSALPDMGSVIERFVQHRFPNAHQHHWIINQTTVEEDEVTVDLKTVVSLSPQSDPIEERYLLLFVKGELTAAQVIPLEGDPDCQKEEPSPSGHSA